MDLFNKGWKFRKEFTNENKKQYIFLLLLLSLLKSGSCRSVLLEDT